MITRTAKLLLLAGIALFYTLVTFNNLTDFDSNCQFVRHVLMMDSTFPGNHGMWRALPYPWIHLSFYISIIAWEIATTILLWWAAVPSFAGNSEFRDRLQHGQAPGDHGTHALAAHVARSLSCGWIGVVPHVAIAYLERTGSFVPHVCCGGGSASADHAARRRNATVAPNRP